MVYSRRRSERMTKPWERESAWEAYVRLLIDILIGVGKFQW